MDILKLEAVYKDIIWGGTLLGEEYGKPKQKIAEAWELAVHPEGDNKILEGSGAGTLSAYLGTSENFPLMIKLIDANDKLSIQVHPVKTEMWIIADCRPGAKLVYGLKGKFSEEEFRKALAEGKAEELLNYEEVHKGDVFFIPQGLVHAIGAGILICEIQENSNVTYRVYDYGRLQNGKPRELHVDAAMKTIKDFDEAEIEKIRYSRGKTSESCLANCDLFKVDRYTVNGSINISSDADFVSIICLEGSGSIENTRFSKGDSLFIKGQTGFTIKGHADVVVSIPN